MSHEIEETGELTREAHVTITPGDLERETNKRLKELSKEVKLKGFRKGKVPLSVMRKRYGAGIQQEVFEETLQGAIDEIVEEQEGGVLHLELEELPEIEAGETMEFTVYFELAPDVDPIGYLGLEVERPTPEIGDEMVDEQLEQMRREHSTLEPIALRTSIAEGDVVNLDLRALGEGEELEKLEASDLEVEVGSGQLLPGIEESLVGLGFDALETVEISLPEEFGVESLRGRDVELELSINTVKKRVLPQLDDEFALDTGEAQTLLELRSKIRDSLAAQLDGYADQMAQQNILDKLLEQNDPSIPPRFLDSLVERELENRLERAEQQGQDPEEVEATFEEERDELREEIRESVKVDFLLRAIAREEGIEVDEQDMQSYFDSLGAQYGISGAQFAQIIQQDRESVQRHVGNATLQKTLQYLLSEANIEETEWPSGEGDHGEETADDEDAVEDDEESVEEE
jgi:trigger factor